jgi:hypothetical protein
VIADEHLPDGSGRELLAWLRARGDACKRVLISGSGVTPQDSDASYELFFGKPEAVRELVHWLIAFAKQRPG